MSKRWSSVVCLAAVIALMAGSSMAQDDDEFGLRGWGPRVGLAADPDQIVAGVHFDLGEFAPQIWFQPDVVLGVGDDVTSLVASAPVWYRFEGASDKITPYAGGALAVGLFDVDRPGKSSDSSVEIGLQIGGGGEWRLRQGRKFQLELRLDLLDVWDALVIAGWTF